MEMKGQNDKPFLEVKAKGAGMTGWKEDAEKKEITVFLSKNKREETGKGAKLYFPSDAQEPGWQIHTKWCANPVLPGQFADPDIALFGDTYYLYATTDGFSGWSGTQFHCFSSKNLVEFKDEGVILDVAGGDVAVRGHLASRIGTGNIIFISVPRMPRGIPISAQHMPTIRQDRSRRWKSR